MTVNDADVFLLTRFRVCESEFVDLTPNKPEKVGDVPSATTAGSRKVPYTIHVGLPSSRVFTINLILSVHGVKLPCVAFYDISVSCFYVNCTAVYFLIIFSVLQCNTGDTVLFIRVTYKIRVLGWWTGGYSGANVAE